MGYRLNRLDEPVFMAVPKPMLTEFGIHYILESCGGLLCEAFIIGSVIFSKRLLGFIRISVGVYYMFHFAFLLKQRIAGRG